MRPGLKAGKVTDGRHAAGKGSRDGEIDGRREVRRGAAGGLEVMQRSAERFLHLGGGPGERDAVAAARHALNAKALALQPVLHRGDVGAGYAELRGILLRGQPLVVQRRAAVLLRGDQCIQRLLLGGGAAEDQRDALNLGRGRDRAHIIGGLGAQRVRPGERHPAGVVDRRRNARSQRGYGLTGLGGKYRQTGKRDNQKRQFMQRRTAIRSGRQRNMQGFLQKICHQARINGLVVYGRKKLGLVRAAAFQKLPLLL